MKVTIIGAGPAGLMATYELLKEGVAVDLYDQNSAAGKKFLVAGHGGLNLTHNESFENFVKRYSSNHELFKTLLSTFSPEDLRSWLENEFGVKTFVGSSKRVFPEKMKAGEILIELLKKIKSFENFKFYPNHKFTKLSLKEKVVEFENQKIVAYERLVFALGGASWSKVGGNDLWHEALVSEKINCEKSKPSNCGFHILWSEFFKEKIDRDYLKNITVSFKDKKSAGDIMLTPYGIEGTPIYELSRFLRDEIENEKSATVYLDLKPVHTTEKIKSILSKGRGKNSWGNFLRKSLKLKKNTYTLLMESCEKSVFENVEELANTIKKLPIKLDRPASIDESISTGGGVSFNNLNDMLQLKGNDEVYFAGEMLDWEAPTGGFLLQASFSMGYFVAKNIMNGKNNV